MTKVARYCRAIFSALRITSLSQAKTDKNAFVKISQSGVTYVKLVLIYCLSVYLIQPFLFYLNVQLLYIFLWFPVITTHTQIIKHLYSFHSRLRQRSLSFVKIQHPVHHLHTTSKRQGTCSMPALTIDSYASSQFRCSSVTQTFVQAMHLAKSKELCITTLLKVEWT